MVCKDDPHHGVPDLPSGESGEHLWDFAAEWDAHTASIFLQSDITRHVVCIDPEELRRIVRWADANGLNGLK